MRVANRPAQVVGGILNPRDGSGGELVAELITTVLGGGAFVLVVFTTGVDVFESFSGTLEKQVCECVRWKCAFVCVCLCVRVCVCVCVCVWVRVYV